MAAHCQNVRGAAVDGDVIVVPGEGGEPVLVRADEVDHGEPQFNRWIKESRSATEIVKRRREF